MTTIETTAHVGPDGVLRLEVPTGQANQDLQVVLEFHSRPAAAAPEAGESAPPDLDDPWRDLRKKLVGVKGITLPPPGRRVRKRPEPIRIDDGKSTSDMLVEDRR
jgi:hypothetical protein